MWTVSTEPEECACVPAVSRSLSSPHLPSLHACIHITITDEQFMQKLYIRVTEDGMDFAPKKAEQEPVPQWKPLEEVKGGTLEVKRKLKYVPVAQRREPRKNRTHHRSTGQQHGTAFKAFGSAFTGRQARSFRWRKEEPIRRRRRRPPPPGIVVAKPSPVSHGVMRGAQVWRR